MARAGSPAPGFAPWAFRTLPYMPALTAWARDAQARREGDRVAAAFAALIGVTSESWRERCEQIDKALDVVELMEARR